MTVASKSRRRFLKQVGVAGGLGGALALFPWLRRARADEPTPKLILFFTPHGTVWDQWRPTGSERGFTWSTILAPLAPHRERVVIVDGLELRVGTPYYVPHTYTMPVLWTGSPIDTAASDFCRSDHMQCFGWNTGVSVDQFIASRLPRTTPYATVELGIGCGGLHPATRMIYGAAGAPKNPLDTPMRSFTTLFGTTTSTEADGFRRRSVLDAVHADLAARRATLSASDRVRLDAHETSLRELERTLIPPSAVCMRPTAPMDVTEQTEIDRQTDLLVASLSCGLTNVASFQHRIADNDGTLYPWLSLNEGGHHMVTHDSSPGAQAILTNVYRWYTERFVYLLDRLAATPDVGGTTMLDNTLVIWGSELGRGWDHDISNVPFVFAGGAAGRMSGGRYLRVTSMRHNRVLVTACHAMGLTDVSQYGSTDTESGPIPTLLSST